MVTFTAYTTAGVSQGTLSPSSAEWSHVQADDGQGTLVVNGDVASAALAETIVIRVNDGTADRFAFISHTDDRRQVEGTTDVQLQGPGVRHLLHAGQVYQEDLSDCALPADVRWFGWMASAYDDSAWTAPASHGTWRSQPFATPRPEGWPAPLAEYIWRTTNTNLDEEDCLFRQDFNVAADQDVVLCITADDEYECWLDGTQLPVGQYGTDTKYAWKDFDQLPLRLCAGSHTFAVRGRNLDIPPPNPAWVIWAFAETAGDGKPAAQNAIWNVTTDATGGTFTCRPLSSATAATIDWNETPADFQTALEALVGSGNVTVTGTAGDWTIEFVGAYANVSEGITLDDTNLTGQTHLTPTETQRGGSASTVARSETSTVVHFDPSSSEPGMTPGAILKTAADEVRARGTTVIDDVTDGYTATTDSDSNAWGFELNLPVPLPASLHRLAVLLEEQGVDVWMDPDLTLQASGEQGSDLTGTVTLTPGTDGVSDTVATQEESTVRNVVRLRTDKGWVDVSDTSSVTARGRWESGLILEGFKTATQAAQHTGLLLGDLSSPQRPTRLDIPSESTVDPYADIGLGSRVNGPVFGTSGFDTAAARLIEISGRLEELSIVWTLGLVD